MGAVSLETPRGQVNGICDERFQAVAAEFALNFAERGEVGASVCITHEGKTVVDLWGGTKNVERDAPWERDTVATIFSCTKGATALCAHILVSRGQPISKRHVAEYWPEFAQNGKEDATVHMMLDTVGVASWHEPLKPGAAFDWEYITGRLASEEPWVEAGHAQRYKMISFGWTVGELVRRVSGKRSALSSGRSGEALGLDFWIGRRKRSSRECTG